MKNLAVLMTCFNRRETTLRALRDLFAQETVPELEVAVYLVDDASMDGTGEQVLNWYRSLQSSPKISTGAFKLHLICGDGSLYWCRGMRLAWDEAGDDFDYYLWLNDDTFIYGDCLKRILDLSDQLDGAIVSGTIADPESGQIVYGGNVNALNGNVLLVPNSAYRKIGSLDDRFHQRYGDHDYGIRAKKAGVRIVATPKAVGTCLFNPGPKGLTSGWSLARRWRSLFCPTEFHLADAYHYRAKHCGVLRGLLSVAHIAFIVMTGRA